MTARRKLPKRRESFAAGVGRGMRRAARTAREVARKRVMKGDQIGMFHFGGSTHCLIFRPEVHLEFDRHGQKPGLTPGTFLSIRGSPLSQEDDANARDL